MDREGSVPDLVPEMDLATGAVLEPALDREGSVPDLVPEMDLATGAVLEPVCSRTSLRKTSVLDFSGKSKCLIHKRHLMSFERKPNQCISELAG